MKYKIAMTDAGILATRVKTAGSFISRLMGLLGRNSLDADEGLHIIPCKQVHTIGMNFPIDVLYLDKSGEIVQIENDMKPGKVGSHIKLAHSVLELASGSSARNHLVEGQQVLFLSEVEYKQYKDNLKYKSERSY